MNAQVDLNGTLATTNSNNLDLWREVFITDPAAVKPITGKSYKGSSPKPYWIVEQATKHFGPWRSGELRRGVMSELLSDELALQKANSMDWFPYTKVGRCECAKVFQCLLARSFALRVRSYLASAISRASAMALRIQSTSLIPSASAYTETASSIASINLMVLGAINFPPKYPFSIASCMSSTPITQHLCHEPRLKYLDLRRCADTGVLLPQVYRSL